MGAFGGPRVEESHMGPSITSSPDPHVAGRLFLAEKAEASTLFSWCMYGGVCESVC